MKRRCAEPRRQHPFRRFTPGRGSSTGRECGSGADQIASTVASTTQCNDVARIGQFRDLSRFGNYGCTLGGTTGKGRERQIILKTDQRTIFLERGWAENSSEIKRMGR
jgi:hypothetical protein